MIVLGLESSCDETAAAIVRDALAPGERILADLVLSQLDDHAPYGGVVPEIAARAHLDHLDRLVAGALDRAGLTLAQVDAIAVTAGPGLIGGLLVGLNMAQGLARGAGKPLIAVNHLEGHALTARLVADVDFPFLLLLVSGGHCQLVAVESLGRYRRLGTTIDDAVGEAFDKVAKLLGLSYPGGPAVERAAASGDATRFPLPRPMIGRPGCDFSFSGLKTAVRQLVDRLGRDRDDQATADIAASFQDTVARVLADRVGHALDWFAAHHPGGRHLVVAGGVAANRAIGRRLEALTAARGISTILPPRQLCTDNAAMIAWAGLERARAGLIDPGPAAARARWPLDPGAEPKPYAGVKA